MVFPSGVTTSCLVEFLSNLLHLKKCLLPLFTGENDHKFIPTVAPNQFIFPSMCLNDFCHRHQHVITRDMPVLVIDRLEFVHIQQCQREWGFL